MDRAKYQIPNLDSVDLYSVPINAQTLSYIYVSYTHLDVYKRQVLEATNIVITVLVVKTTESERTKTT